VKGERSSAGPVVVFLRGVNVGGYRTFRPSILARELSAHAVVNVGAAGTFVVRKPGPEKQFRVKLLGKLPFEADIAICRAADLLRLESEHPFTGRPPPPDVVRFLSVLCSAGRGRVELPLALPQKGEWLFRVLARKGRFVFGEYRRQMKAIGYLGRIDQLFGAPATTRNWTTIQAIIEILKDLPTDTE
jgi:uncharacterized protein (DUF1697 family)